MKEINEIMQMRIFDLLEGNLNEKEAFELKQEIENNSALKKEYELMAKTYLQSDEIVFMNKNSLYKKPGLFIQFNSIQKFAVAASIALLFVSISVFWFGIKETKKSETALKSDSKMIEHSLPKITSTPEDTNQSKYEFSGSIPSVLSQYFKENNKSNSVEIIENDSLIEEIEIGPNPIAILPNPIAEQTNDKKDTAGMQIPDNSIVNEPIKFPVSVKKKRSLSYKLLNGSRQMLATLQLPKIKFITENNKGKIIPKIKMQIDTPNTAIIATIYE